MPNPAVSAAVPSGVGIVLKASFKKPGLKRGFANKARLCFDVGLSYTFLN